MMSIPIAARKDYSGFHLTPGVHNESEEKSNCYRIQ